MTYVTEADLPIGITGRTPDGDIVKWDGTRWMDDFGRVYHSATGTWDPARCDPCQSWENDGGYIPEGALDVCKPNPAPTAIEGNIMDTDRRIKYNDKEGHWEVIFNGRVITKAFKSSGDAYQYMRDLAEGRKKPEDK